MKEIQIMTDIAKSAKGLLMTNDKDETTGFRENVVQEFFEIPSQGKLKKGKMSKAFEAALDAVENIGKESQN